MTKLDATIDFDTFTMSFENNKVDLKSTRVKFNLKQG